MGRVDRLQLLAGHGFIFVEAAAHRPFFAQGCDRRAVRLVDLKNIKQAFALPAHAAGDVQHFSEHTVEIDRPQIFVVNLHAVRDRVERALKQLFSHVFPSRQNAMRAAVERTACDVKVLTLPEQRAAGKIPRSIWNL